jgi:hypothetical protein
LTEVDPRLFLTDPDKFERLQPEAAAAADRLFAERLASGEPLEVARYMVGGNHYPLERDHPLRDRSVKKLRVFPDDRVVPLYDA